MDVVEVCTRLVGTPKSAVDSQLLRDQVVVEGTGLKRCYIQLSDLELSVSVLLSR